MTKYRIAKRPEGKSRSHYSANPDMADAEGRSIPGTDNQLVAIMYDRECWTITHKASGFAVCSASSRERCIEVGKLFWRLLGPEKQAVVIQHGANLPHAMKADLQLRDSLAPAGIEARRISREEQNYPTATICELHVN